jgi:group I intron endonuclease
MVGIYKITCEINGKMYVGKSKCIERRWKTHRSGTKHHHNRYFHADILKHGIGKFKFAVLEKCEEHLLDEREIYWIKELNTTNPGIGYNMTQGGDGENTSRWIDYRQVGKSVSRTMSGRKLSDEHRKHISDGLKGIQSGMNNAMFGRHHTQEARKIISESHRGNGNGQYGTHWFTDGTVNVKGRICPEGFYPGRVV